jgi:hypothetical protein
MGSAVKKNENLYHVVSSGRLLEDVVCSLPHYFELDLNVALKFDVSRPYVRMAHLLTSPFLSRLKGVQPHIVYIVFGYAIERLIGFSVGRLDDQTAQMLSCKLGAYQQLEKGTRCLNLSKSVERQLACLSISSDADTFPVGRVIFESIDGHQRFVVEGQALNHVAESLRRTQGIAGDSNIHPSSQNIEDRETSLAYLKCLAFESTLQQHDLLSNSQKPEQYRIERFRLLRHLYRFIMMHARPKLFPMDGWMRRLMFDVATMTIWPECDSLEQPVSAGMGKLSVISKT